MKKDHNKVVVITGASSGIGLATAEYLNERGYVVYGFSRRKAANDKFTLLQADVCNHLDVVNAFEYVYEREKRIDVVINNAGMGISGPIENTDKADVEKIFNTNVVGLIDVCSVAIKYLKQTRGRIVNIGSVGGPAPLPFQACYSACKSAVETFSYALNGEVSDFGIRVICVRPGDTKTGFTSARIKTLENDKDYGNRVQRSVEKMEKDEQGGKSPVSVSKVIYGCLKRKNPPPVVTVGYTYKLICSLLKILPQRFVNRAIKKIYGGNAS